MQDLDLQDPDLQDLDLQDLDLQDLDLQDLDRAGARLTDVSNGLVALCVWARVVFHPLIFRCARSCDYETTDKNNLLYGTLQLWPDGTSPQAWDGADEKRKSPRALRLAGILCGWVR